MGCGSSNQVGVVGTGSPTSKPKTIKVKSNGEIEVESSKRLLNNNNAIDRGGSATSKTSRRTMDSGFANEEDYGHIITEDSDPNMVAEIEGGFKTPRDLDFGLTGVACPQRLSAKDKARLEEQRVIAGLREEGLITRPVSRAAGGVRFEITADIAPEMLMARKPPARLAKLEKRKKKKRVLTKEELEEKMRRAEERRKERENEKIEKIQAITAKSDVLTALDSFEKSQKVKETKVESKIDSAAENREKRLKEMRDKLKAKQEYAEMVRRRKKLAPIVLDDEAPKSNPTTPRGYKSSDGLPPLS